MFIFFFISLVTLAPYTSPYPPDIFNFINYIYKIKYIYIIKHFTTSSLLAFWIYSLLFYVKILAPYSILLWHFFLILGLFLETHFLLNFVEVVMVYLIRVYSSRVWIYLEQCNLNDCLHFLHHAQINLNFRVVFQLRLTLLVYLVPMSNSLKTKLQRQTIL